MILAWAGCASKEAPGPSTAIEQGAAGQEGALARAGDEEVQAGRPETTSPGASLGPSGPEVLLGAAAQKRDFPAVAPHIAETNGLLVAIDTPYQIFQHQGSYVHVAAWQQSGEPAKGAHVYVGMAHVGNTDEHGVLAFVYPPKHPTTGQRDTLSGGQIHVVDVQDEARRGAVAFNPGVRTASFATDRIYVYTDRGVYRPGDSVRVRAIGWHLKEDYKPLEEVEIEFQLKDASGQLVGGATQTTTSFGTAALQIPVPVTAKEGLYTLNVSYKNARQSARLQVRRFEPPAVELDHTLGRFITKAQPSLTTSVTLTPTLGGQLAPGKLVLQAEARGKQVFELTKEVTTPGPHAFDVPPAKLAALKAKLSEQAFASLKLIYQQTDGTRSQVVREMRYVTNPVVAVIELDKDQYATGDEVKIVAKLRDLDGVPLRDQPVRLKIGEKTYTQTTSAQGMAVFSSVMGGTSVSATLYVADVADPVASQQLRWTKPRAMVSSLEEPVVKEAQQASVTVRFPTDVVPLERVVHMDVVDTSGAIVNAVLLPIEHTPQGWVAKGTFTSPTWGSMLLTFFALGKKDKVTLPKTAAHHHIGLMTEGQNLVVYPNRELEITLDGLPEAIAPGRPLRIQGEVRDAQGSLVESELGVTLADKRILGLKDPLEITPMDQFYDPTLRTMSTTGSKILSWPVVSRNWGGHVWDVALPPFPFLPGGPVKANAPGQPGGLGGAALQMAPSMDQEEGAMMMEDSMPAPQMEANDSSASGFGALEAQSMGRDGMSAERRSSRSQAPAPDPVQISIRTEFPDTAFWQPHLQSTGPFSTQTEVPDSMAEQEVIVVASDRQGGVGLTRHTVLVTQPLFAQAHLPDVLRAGDQLRVPLLVRNTTDRDLTASIAIKAPGLKMALATEAKEVTIKAKGQALVPLELRADTPGTHLYQISVLAPGFGDLVAGQLHVSPAGVPHTVSTSGWTAPKKPFTHTFTLPPKATGNQASLHVMMPAMTTAFAGLQQLDKIVHQSPLALTTDLASASLVLQYARKHGMSSEALTDLQGRVLQALASLQFAQAADGSFSYWRHQDHGSAYITAWAVEGMIEAQQLDFPVPQDSLKRALAWLATQVGADGLVPTGEISFWQGQTKEVQQGLSAHVFAILSRVPASQTTPALEGAMARMKAHFVKAVPAATLPPLTTAYATEALHRTGALTQQKLDPVMARLLQARDTDHWEPSWFHAWGGRIEATTAMISLMAQVDPTAYRPQMRDALRWILSTSDSWGHWHNERGTASAIRALMLAGISPKDIAGTLVVKLDGKVLKTVAIDPKDPFLSALALEHVSLGQNLPPGPHTVAVSFDGEPVAVRVEQTLWQTAQKPLDTGTFVAKKDFSGPTQSVLAPLGLKVSLTYPIGPRHAELRIARSGLVQLDQVLLANFIASSNAVVDWWADPDTLGVRIAPGTSSLTLPLHFVPTAPGSGTLPTVSLFVDGTLKGTLAPVPITLR